MNTIIRFVGCCALLALAAVPARAGYMMSLTHAGNSSAAVLPGGSLVLDIAITADAAETHNSAVFRVEFSAPGLRYAGYEWESPYLNGTLDDDSKPLGFSLPVLLDDLLLSGVGYPDNVVDIELSNVLPIGPNFGSGMVAHLTIQVPEMFAGAPNVLISLVPDQIALNGAEISTRTSGSFNLIIPSPSVSALFLVTVSGVLTRRGRRGNAA